MYFIMDKLKRVNWESVEKELLTEIITPYIKIIENKNCNTNTNKSKLDAWEHICKDFNNTTKTKRTLPQIKVEWKRMKVAAKKNVTSFKQSWKKTGGGPPPESVNALDYKLQSLMPIDFVKDSNCFDSDNVEDSRKTVQHCEF